MRTQYKANKRRKYLQPISSFATGPLSKTEAAYKPLFKRDLSDIAYLGILQPC